MAPKPPMPEERWTPPLKMMVSAMQYKLRMNAKKGTWEQYTVDDLFSKLEAEIAELRQAIQDGSPVEILLESADCGNFLVMISERAIQQCVLPLGAAIPIPPPVPGAA